MAIETLNMVCTVNALKQQFGRTHVCTLHDRACSKTIIMVLCAPCSLQAGAVGDAKLPYRAAGGLPGPTLIGMGTPPWTRPGGSAKGPLLAADIPGHSLQSVHQLLASHSIAASYADTKLRRLQKTVHCYTPGK